MMVINMDLLEWFINFLIKRLLLRMHSQRPYLHELSEINLLVVVLKMRIFQIKNQLKNQKNQLLEKSRKEKYSQLLQTLFGGAHLADMQLISNFNKGIHFLLCVFDIFSKCTWVIPLKDENKYYNY